MIIFIEGLSTTGKSYLVDKIIEKKPDWIKFKGAGAVNIGMQNRWQEYNFWMHNIIEHLDKLNNYKKVILWDRGLTDAVYSDDENYRKEILRVIKSHRKKCVVFIGVDLKDWFHLAEKRNSKEGSDYLHHSKEYNKILPSFDLHVIKLKSPDFYIEDSDIDSVINFIEDKLKNE